MARRPARLTRAHAIALLLPAPAGQPDRTVLVLTDKTTLGYATPEAVLSAGVGGARSRVPQRRPSRARTAASRPDEVLGYLNTWLAEGVPAPPARRPGPRPPSSRTPARERADPAPIAGRLADGGGLAARGQDRHHPACPAGRGGQVRALVGADRAGAGLWQVTEDVLVAYLDQLGTGSDPAADLNRGGKPLAWHLANLNSLYGYAARRRVIGHSPSQWVEAPEVGKAGTTPLALPEGTALVRGAQAIAAKHPADAAVALLATTGMRAGELESLTVRRIERSAGHGVIRFRLKGGAVIVVPLPEVAMALLRPLLAGRKPNDLLLQRADGRSFDHWRQQTALRRAARAAGLDLAKLTPQSPADPARPSTTPPPRSSTIAAASAAPRRAPLRMIPRRKDLAQAGEDPAPPFTDTVAAAAAQSLQP